MPLVYLLHCEQCDAEGDSEITYDGFVGASLIASRNGGKIVTSHFPAYLNEEDVLIALPHPLEASTLEEQGVTWSQARFSGRLFGVTILICQNCGALNHSPKLNTSAGCLAPIACYGITFALLRLLTSIPVAFIALLAMIPVGLPDLLLRYWLNSRYRDRVARHAFKGCHRCGSTDTKAVEDCVNKRVVCEKCGNKSSHLTVAGIS
jgi:hypothetical protein